MKDSQKETLVHILRDLIRQNRIDRNDPLSRHRLKGAQTERTQAVADATNLLATLRLAGRSPREYNPASRQLVQELRSLASDFKLTASARLQAAMRLAFLAGFIPEPPANEALDQLLRTYCEEKVVPVAPAPVVDYKKLLADIDEKLAKGEICSTTNS